MHLPVVCNQMTTMTVGVCEIFLLRYFDLRDVRRPPLCEICVLGGGGFYPGLSGIFFPTFGEKLSVPSSGVKESRLCRNVSENLPFYAS